MQGVRNVTHRPKGCPRSQHEIRGSVRLTAALFVLLLCLLTVLCPVYGLTGPGNQGSTANAPRVDRGIDLETWEKILIAAIALFFAWLRLLTDFPRYRGLLHVLLWNWYSWAFLVFIAAGIFLIDFLIWPYVRKMIHEALIAHISLFIGHTGVSAALAYGTPLLLAKIPFQDNPRPKKEPTEMNVIFAAIRESLANRANAELCKWTTVYNWNVLRFAAYMLISDQVSSKTLPEDEGEALKQWVAACQECDDRFNDMQKKYELMLKMMSLSSFTDLQSRLRQAVR